MREYIPGLWQRDPLHPGRHSHLLPSTHRPPFLQFFEQPTKIEQNINIIKYGA